MKLLKKLFNLILSPLISLIDLPVVPDELVAIVNKTFDYMRAGVGFFNFICPLDLIKPAIDIFLAVYIFEHGYYIVMWIVKKIPMLGIS